MRIFNPFRRFIKPKPDPPSHVHSWRAIAVNPGSANGYPATHILRQCECGDYNTEAVYGRWTLEQVSAGGIVEELKRMASL